MWQIVIAFLAPILHGFGNILDSNFVNKYFRNPWSLVFFSSIFSLIFLPIVWIIQHPSMLSAKVFPFIVLIALIEVIYLYPYYKALQHADTSIVTALFSISKVLVPILAFFVVGERLSIWQYIGFILIISSSIALSWKGGPVIFNKSLWYMILVSGLLAIEAVIYKYVFETVNWSTGFTWVNIVSFILAFGILLIPKQRKNIIKDFSVLKRKFRLFFTSELLGFLGTAASALAISILPVTVVKGINASQSFITLIYAIILAKAIPEIFKEAIDLQSIIKKIFCFILVIIGIILII